MRLARIALLLILSLAVSFAAERSAQRPRAKGPQPAIPGVEYLPEVEIGTGGGRALHAVIARPQKPPKSPMPAVLWIHGGGWSGGNHKGNRAASLAAQGYFTASIEYRLSGEAKWPAQIEDCKLGVRWLRANASKYNVNPDRIGVWGSSAGGHLVACLGTMDDKRFEGSGGYPGVSSRVQAVVDFCGPADFTRGSGGIQGATDRDASAPLGLFGAPYREKPDLWKDGSPIVYAKSGLPPFLIVHGDHDATVPHNQSARFAEALKKCGVPVDLLTVKGGGHGMSALPGQPPAEPDQKTIQETVLAFFDKHLKK